MAVRWEDLEVGRQAAVLDKGVITTAHIMRWSAAVENWHRIHYDLPFATGHDKLPGVLINGSWKQHVLVQLVKDLVGPECWLWKIKFRYRKMDLAGDSLKAHAEVMDKREIDGLGFALLAIVLEDQNGEVSTAGHALAVMPLARGPAVPYPFVPRPAFEAMRLPADA